MAVAEHRWRVMASEALVVAVGDPAHCDHEIERAIGLLDHLEARWSRFLPESDVTRLHHAGGAPIAVDRSTLVLLTTMQAAARHTDGAFDATLLPDLVASGYVASIDVAERVTVLPQHLDRRRRLDEIELDPVAGLARLPNGLTLDPGGIGKGLAADLAVEAALDRGIEGILVSIGGDLAMAGRAPDDDGWHVRVEHPEPDQSALGEIVIDRGGIATSSTRSRRWRHAGEWRHHLIDPATGRSATTDLAAVTVVAATGWLAEAHATAALLAGSHDAVRHLDDHGLSGVVVADDGSIRCTADLTGLERAA